MRLKDAMTADVRTFLNPDEFSTDHEWEGRTISMVVQDDIENGSPLPYAEGVSLYRKICHIDAVELTYIPRRGDIVNFDGVEHVITSCEPAEGLLKIAIEANV
ncbi:hypothetical protein B9G55_01425 [Saccharibacillus sp. O16]|nr:hypothetical protein B9G55_01425 [Saccharibacillus sp. O16]